MRSKAQLMQNATRLTLFTRPNCGLCESAKLVLRSLSRKKYFEMKQVDVMDPVNEGWKKIYEFDTPVVRIRQLFVSKISNVDYLQLHVERMSRENGPPDLGIDARKLMHRFTETQVEQMINEVEGQY